MSTSDQYILNTIQSTGGLYPVYQSIAAGSSTKAAVMEDVGLSEKQFEPAYQGLRLLGIVGKKDHELYAPGLDWYTGSPITDFRMTALENLASQCTSTEAADWGKQAVVLLAHRYLIENDIQYFERTDKGLYEKIEQWYLRELDFEPMSSQGRYKLNDNKFANWARIATFLGLIEKTNGAEHALYIDPRLIFHSIRRAADGGTYLTIQEYISWLNQNLLQVKLTNDGRIPAAVSRTLYTLIRDGKLRFVERGDAGAVRLTDVPSSDSIENDANTIEIRS